MKTQTEVTTETTEVPKVEKKARYPRRQAGAPEGLRVNVGEFKPTGRTASGKFLANRYQSDMPLVTFHYYGRG